MLVFNVFIPRSPGRVTPGHVGGVPFPACLAPDRSQHVAEAGAAP